MGGLWKVLELADPRKEITSAHLLLRVFVLFYVLIIPLDDFLHVDIILPFFQFPLIKLLDGVLLIVYYELNFLSLLLVLNHF